MFNYSRSELGPHRLMTQGSSFRQCIGAAIKPVFPVILAFWSFQLSGHYSCSIILAILWSIQSLKTKEILKGKVHRIIQRLLPVVKEIAY
jgi:hypothetical protein